VRKFNILAPQLDLTSEREGYRSRSARVGAAVGAEQIGASLYELGDGQRSFPYHFHHGMEEWLLVVSGSPVVRTPDGERVLREGDILCFPVGAAGGHQVTGPGTVLIISDKPALDVAEYPDSGKVAMRPPGLILRTADTAGYWDGE
jgi:uncharacterized cupin superfamily protein